MTLSVYVQGKQVGSLQSVGDFKSSMAYLPGVHAEDFVSLTMGVRGEPYIWDDVLHPFFQMNLPEGYLLQVLQEKFGPVVGASPMALLSVIGKNMIGRVQVAPEGAGLEESVRPVDVEALLQGDNSEERFADLVRQHASSGVSGIVPKFLDEAEECGRGHHKATIHSHRHVIKGSSRQLPFVSLNEHLCMEIARRVMPSASTRVSDDGQALVVAHAA
jgi:serine/threonine-protein kinase HipA